MRFYLLYGLMLLLLLICGVVVFSLVSGQDAFVFATLPLLLLFIPTLFVYLLTAATAARKARIEGMTTAAALLNGEFYPRASRQLEREFAACSLAQLPGGKAIENVISGNQDGCALRVFNFTHTTWNGKHSSTTIHTVALLPGVCPDAPSFRLSPERIWHKLHEAVGGEDIDFDDTLAGNRFSKSYVLQSWNGLNGGEIRAFFTEDLIKFFAERPGWCVEVVAGSVIVWRPPSFTRELARAARRMQAWIPEDVRELVDQALAIKTAVGERLYER